MVSYTTQTLGLSNLQRADVRANPYPFYAELRTQDPVHWDEEQGFWALTRYADIGFVYTDPRFSRAEGLMSGYARLPEQERGIATPVYDSFAKTMFYSDPPYHTHLRGLVNSAFTPRRVEHMGERIREIVDDLLDEVQGGGRMDVIRDLAYPLPILVVAEMLGFPAVDRLRLKKWSDDLFATLGTVRRPSHGMLEAAARSLAELTDYVVELSRARRLRPQDDLLTALVTVMDGGTALTQDELVANVNILLSAGHETTSNLLGNGLLALLENPAELQRLKQMPALVAPAVEEMMRYDNPVQIAYRSAAADVELDGRTIRRGQLVNMVLGAANRDPERFPDPDRFDVTRDQGKHLGLGLGIHFCLGAPLLRLEMQIAFTRLLQRLPRLRLGTNTLEWQEHPIFRGVKSLQVEF